jgi:hypothetical protein
LAEKSVLVDFNEETRAFDDIDTEIKKKSKKIFTAQEHVKDKYWA